MSAPLHASSSARSVAPLQVAQQSLPVAWGVESEGKDEVRPYSKLSRPA